MGNHVTWKRICAVLLAVVLTLGTLPLRPAYAAGEELENLPFVPSDITPDLRLPEASLIDRSDSGEDSTSVPEPNAEDVVRVSIVLDEASTIAAGYAIDTIAVDPSAVSYRNGLLSTQDTVQSKIEQDALDGKRLDVVWNLTLAANIISANVEYGKVEAIKAIRGVKDVFVETKYSPMETTTPQSLDPNMSTSSQMIGSAPAYASGYTGAGSRVAIIDTGIDSDHQLFAEDSFLYSLGLNAQRKQMDSSAYIDALDLLDDEELSGVLSQLHVKDGITAADLSLSAKVPFAYNYVDENLDVTHDNDTQGEHGSHVSGIAAANAYLKTGDGYALSLDEVMTQGVAPDAQILTMKVFGTGGGAYDSDYMAAIEDAIVLGADAINLSLGSSLAGFGHNDTYQAIMDSLSESLSVVTISAGNNGSWTDGLTNGTLYGQDINFHTGGSPGTYSNALTVASVDNVGYTDAYLQFGNAIIYWYESLGYGNESMQTVTGDQGFVYLAGPEGLEKWVGFGQEHEFNALKDVVAGKIVFLNRGDIDFATKANNAAAAGAKALVVINSEPGILMMDLTGYEYTMPVVSLSQEDGALLWSLIGEADKHVIEYEYDYYGSPATETLPYATGTIQVHMPAPQIVTDKYIMSEFSSWGIPGTLKMKPEITAPGGNIYSINGAISGGEGYENMSGTSMAAPQVAGMTAVLAQYVRENDLAAKTGQSERTLIQSLLMSTAVPIVEDYEGNVNSAGMSAYYYSVLQQGAGLGNVGAAAMAQSYILMGADANDDYADGKVKVELGDDPGKTGSYSYSFTLNNISGAENSYSLSTDLFTQDLTESGGYLWLNKWTTPLIASVEYYVNGEKLETKPAQAHDVDLDGDTDADDAQALLDYIVGVRSGDDLDLPAGDLDGDKKYTSYDAHLILACLDTQLTVPANGSLNIRVDIQLKDARLDQYVDGAYVEGFTYVRSLASSEGGLDVTHSIPILGFYGNWSQPAMFDHVGLREYLYGTDEVPDSYMPGYTYGLGGLVSNFLIYQDGDGEYLPVMGNPYEVEETYPEEKAAIRSTDVLAEYDFALIRNASDMALVVTDGSGKVLTVDAPYWDTYAPVYLYDESAGDYYWSRTDYPYPCEIVPAELGLSNGDAFSVSLVAVPEYYSGVEHLTASQIADLVSAGTLGDGAYLTTKLHIDDVAPEVIKTEKNADGDLICTVKDDQYIAYVAVLSRSGVRTFYQAVPGSGKGETYQFTVPAEDLATAGKYCMVMVADYAQNENAVLVNYDGEEDNGAGGIFGFTEYIQDANKNGSWVRIDPETVAYKRDNPVGLTPVNVAPMGAQSADYVDGYVFFAGYDGIVYAAPQVELDYATPVATLPEEVGDPWAMAYYDGSLYIMGSYCELFKVNPLTGLVEYVCFVDATASSLTTMTVDDEGTFYALDYNGTLHTWTLPKNGEEEVSSEEVSLSGKFIGNDGYDTYDMAYSIAWDHENDVLYAAGGYLWKIDVKASEITPELTNKDADNYYASKLPDTYGLYIVPTTVDGESQFDPTNKVEGITLSKTALTLYTGNTVTLEAELTPWNLANKDVTWTSSETTVATVDGGKVTGLAEGTATITAASVADPTKTAECVVTVKAMPSVELNGFVWADYPEQHWASFNLNDTASWQSISAQSGADYYAGALSNGKLYVHDTESLYEVDPATFTAKKLSDFYYDPAAYGVSFGVFSDAAPCPAFPDGTSLGSDLVALSYLGTLVELVNFDNLEDPIAWQLVDENSNYLLGAPMVGIAFLGQDSYQPYANYANYYAVITEAGDIYEIVLSAYDLNADGKIDNVINYDDVPLCSTGIDLTGASEITEGEGATDVSVSLIYDAESGNLILSAYTGGNANGSTAYLYLLEMNEDGTVNVARSNGFGADVCPVTALYQGGAAAASLPNWASRTIEAEIASATALNAQNVVSVAKADAPEQGVYTGTLNSISTTSPVAPTATVGKQVQLVNTEDNTVTIGIYAIDSTNGLFTVDYDETILTLKSVEGNTAYYAYNAETAGTVLFDCASIVELNQQIATLVFSYAEENEANLSTTVTITTLEDGPALDKNEPETVTIRPPEVYHLDLQAEHGTITGPEAATEGQDLVLTLQPAPGFTLPRSAADIVITVGGVRLSTGDFIYNPLTGTVTIPAEWITGEVTVAVTFPLVFLPSVDPTDPGTQPGGTGTTPTNPGTATPGTAGSSSDTPKTGDEAPILLWAGLALASLAAGAYLLVERKRFF